MSKKRILFVDDEPNILQGLNRMLRSMRAQWDMEFFDNAKEALKFMENNPSFDVVVTDMRMPHMDGVEFLSEVMNRHPEAIRIALSGQMERDIGLRAVRVANLCLWKPCDAEVLKIAVTRAYTLRNRLSDPSLQRLISQCDSLPSLPLLYMELQQEMLSKDISVKAVGDIISKDIGMSSKILQLVNSSFFGISRIVSDPADAVMILGLELVSSLVLILKVFKEIKPVLMSGFPIEKLWNHSLLTASCAKEIAQVEKQSKDIVGGCFISGLLHDIGKLVLINSLPNKYREVLKKEEIDGLNTQEAEIEIFGSSHAHVGASLLGTWGLPDPVVEAVTFHHNPDEFPVDEFRPLSAVHVADAFAYVIETGNEERLNYINKEYMARAGLLDRIPVWLEKCKSLDIEG